MVYRHCNHNAFYGGKKTAKAKKDTKKEKLQKYFVIYKKSIDKLKHLCYSNIRKKV